MRAGHGTQSVVLTSYKRRVRHFDRFIKPDVGHRPYWRPIRMPKDGHSCQEHHAATFQEEDELLSLKGAIKGENSRMEIPNC